jgi:hypothetical protein
MTTINSKCRTDIRELTIDELDAGSGGGVLELSAADQLALADQNQLQFKIQTQTSEYQPTSPRFGFRHPLAYP